MSYEYLVGIEVDPKFFPDMSALELTFITRTLFYFLNFADCLIIQ